MFDEKAHYSIARAGYAGRGVLYIIIGSFAVAAAVGSDTDVVDTEGALRALLDQPAGLTLLAVVAVCLFIYALWRLFQVIFDPDDHGYSLRGVFVRLGLLCSGVGYGGLGLVAVGFILRPNAETESGGTIESLLHLEHGQLLVWGGAIIVGVVGTAHFIKGFRAGFEKRFHQNITPTRWLVVICQFGLIMRGFAYVVVACLFALAAYENESRAAGLTDAMDIVREQPFGPYLFVALALGLFCYGIYSFVEVRYRNMDG